MTRSARKETSRTTKRTKEILLPSKDLLCLSTAVERFDVGRVESESVRAVLDDLLVPLQVCVACSSVRIVDCLLVQLDGLGVDVDRLLVLLAGVGLVALGLELSSDGLATLLCELEKKTDRHTISLRIMRSLLSPRPEEASALPRPASR